MARLDTCASRLAWTLLLGACDAAHQPADEAANAATADCYSPDQNLDRAYEVGAKGCPCDAKADEGHCIDGVALVCPAGRWQAVVDGPCELSLPNAPTATTTTSVPAPSPATDTTATATSPAPTLIMSPPAVSSSGPREACEPVSCTPYAYCDRTVPGGGVCRAKRNAGTACAEDRMCASGKCTSGQCRASEPNPTKGCTGTWDCGGESIARTICSNRDCEVCVQAVNPEGQPNLWAALENASSCDCPEPTVR